MADITKPMALDESIHTTELTPRNIADVLASGLANIANNVKPDGSDISISVPGMTANNVNDGFSELKGTLTDISKTVTSSVSFTPNSGLGVSIDANRTVFKERNGIILARLGLSISTPSNFNTNTEYNMGTFGNFSDYNLGGYALGIVVRNADSKQIGNYMLTSSTLYVNFTIAPPTTIYMEFTFMKTS